VRSVWSLVDRASKGVRNGLSLLVARVKALRRAVRVDNFRLAQRLRMGLVLYLRHLEQPLQNDVARLFEVSGLWVRNVGNRHHTKRNIQRISRRIIQRLHPFIADAPSLLVEEVPIKQRLRRAYGETGANSDGASAPALATASSRRT